MQTLQRFHLLANFIIGRSGGDEDHIFDAQSFELGKKLDVIFALICRCDDRNFVIFAAGGFGIIVTEENKGGIVFAGGEVVITVFVFAASFAVQPVNDPGDIVTAAGVVVDNCLIGVVFVEEVFQLVDVVEAEIIMRK